MKKHFSKVFCGILFVPILASCLSAQVSVIGELSQDKDAKPGDSYSGVVVVRNDTNEPQEAKVYQTDYAFRHDGTNNYGEPGSLPRSNAKWIAFSPSFMTLPPQGTMAVNYTVTVPKESESKKMIGTYWSMLMVEGIQKGSAESSVPRKDKKAQMGITQTIRYGIQVATTIANTGAKKVQFLGIEIMPQKDGKRALQVDIENTGDIVMRPDVYVELLNAQGISLGKFQGVKFRIYPGTSVRQLIDLSKVAKGTYKAFIVVDAGGEDNFGAQYTLKI
jgi:hypothetical protein